MATIAKRTIAGFTVEIEQGENGIECWISKGRDSASLAVAEDYGELNDGTSVDNGTLDFIREFAEKYGY